MDCAEAISQPLFLYFLVFLIISHFLFLKEFKHHIWGTRIYEVPESKRRINKI